MAQVREPVTGTGRRKLVLVGFMGSGKSHAASVLGKRLGVEPLDSDKLSEHVCVYLDVPTVLAWERANRSARPLARDHDQFLALHAERVPLYESVARAVVPVDAEL